MAIPTPRRHCLLQFRARDEPPRRCPRRCQGNHVPGAAAPGRTERRLRLSLKIPPMSALTPEQIAKLRADGKTIREIAAEVGVSVTTIHRWKDPAFRARHDASARRSRLRHPERIKARRKRYLERVAPRCSRCGRPLARPTASREPVVCGACYSEAVAERQKPIWKLSLRGLGPTAIAERSACPNRLSPTTWASFVRGASFRRPGPRLRCSRRPRAGRLVRERAEADADSRPARTG